MKSQFKVELDFASLIVSALLGGVFVFWILKRLNQWYYVSRVEETASPLPPGDMGWPFLGKTLYLIKCLRSGNPNSFISSLVSRYGKTGIYKSHLFGSPTIIVCKAELCRKVLTSEECFGPGYPKSVYVLLGSESSQPTSNIEHKHFRRQLGSPINGHQALTMYVERIEDIVINSLDELAGMNKQLEFFVEMKTAMFKIMASVLIGAINDSTFWTMLNLYTDFREGVLSMAIKIPGLTFYKALKAKEELVKILKSILNEKRATATSNQHKGKKALMDLLMEVEGDNGQKFKDEHIVKLVLSSSPGIQSSALLALWAMVHLSEHPEAFEKAKKEQEEIMKRRPSTQRGINFEEIKQMKYLAKAIDETLRKLSAFSIFRGAKVDVSINGYTIPKGWKVIVWVGAVHMDPEIYENPQDFDPSRWDNMKNKGAAFMPFGAGGRFCLGSDLTRLVITILLHHFVLNYRLKRVNPKSPLRFYEGPMTDDNCLAELTKIS